MKHVEWRVRLAEPLLGQEELEAIGRVFSSGRLTAGPWTERFEEQFARLHEVPHAVALSSGTTALAAIMTALEIGPGDEVVVPSMTFVSTATSVLHVGATPVFADVRPDIFTIDPSDVERRLTPRTKAVIAVHYGGQPADLDELLALCEDAGIHLIEDAAEAHGATYKGRRVGSFGVAAMFSFTPTKNFTTGEGGMVTTRDATLAAKLRALRNHGQTDLYVHESLGYNWRITEMQAAIGTVQLSRFDAVIAKKRRVAAKLSELLYGIDGVRPPVELPDRMHVWMLYTILAEDRDALAEHMRARGIETRLYFPPAHRQPIFEDVDVELPVTDELAATMLSLPAHTRMSDEDVECVAGEVRDFYCARGHDHQARPAT